VVVTRKAGSVGNRRMFQLNNIVPEFNIGTHKNCLINLEKSVLERVFFVKDAQGNFTSPPTPARGVFARRLRPFERIISRCVRTQVPLSGEEFLATVVPAKRRAYEEAFTSLLEDPLKPFDAYVNVFIKYEKEVFQGKTPVPRCISPRSYRYLFSDGCYYHRLEKIIQEDIDNVFQESTVMKGKTVEGVASVIVEKWTSIPDPIAIGVDATRFDQHVSYDALRWQHEIQSMYYAGEDKSRYKRILRMKLENKGRGRTPDGSLRFGTRGKRMSGDMDTGGGNVLLMCAMMYCYFRSLDIPEDRIKLINNGDDCVIFTSRRYESLVRSTLDPWFLSMGFSMVCEPTSHHIEQVEFCQMRPVNIDGRWRMVRNPMRAIPKDCTSIRRIDIPSVYKKWTSAVSDCGLSLCNGVPVQQAFYESIGNAHCGVRVKRSTSRRVQQRAARLIAQDDSGLYKWKSESKVKWAPVSESTRISYWIAFGITPDHQRYLETFYNETTTCWGKAVVEPKHHPSALYLLIY
jgi:hypothetical protein